MWLKTLGSRVTVSLLKAPEGGGLAVKACPTKTSYLCKERVLRLHQGEGKSADKLHNKGKEKSLIKMKSCWSLEIALAPLTLPSSRDVQRNDAHPPRCRGAAEDLLFAIVF